MKNNVYSASILRNFEVGFLKKDVLKKFFPNRTKPSFTHVWKSFPGDSYTRISKIIKTCSEGDAPQIDCSEIEKYLYNELFYVIPNKTHIFPFKPNFKDIEEIKNIFPNRLTSAEATINKKVQNINSFQIINIKIINKQKINILFRAGITKDEHEKNIVFMIPCEIDLSKEIIQIKYKNSHLSKSNFKFTDIKFKISLIIKNLHLGIVGAYNQASIRKSYYDLFETESNRAEELIINEIGRETYTEKLQETKNFLVNTLNINEEDPMYENYTNRTISTFLQQTAIDMADAAFIERFLFAFTFYDGMKTRSSTRNSDRTHIYSTNLYWALKNLILSQNEKSVSVLGMTYNFEHIKLNDNIETDEFETDELETDGNPLPIFLKTQVNLKEQQQGYLIEFLNIDNKNRDPKRGVKNEYILSELSKYM